MSKRKTPADEALSQLSVCRATQIADHVCILDAIESVDAGIKIFKEDQPKLLRVLTTVRECLTDALEFVDRGIETFEEAQAKLTRALVDADVPFRKSGKKKRSQRLLQTRR